MKLIEAGADVNAREELGNTPLHAACAKDSRLTHYIAGLKPDPEDVRKNEAKLAMLLLAHGAEPHAANELGDTPLHMAAKASNELTIRLLLDLGGEVNLPGRWDRTPLHIAATPYGRVEPVAVLLDAGADVRALDRFGATPLDEALEWRSRILEDGNSPGKWLQTIDAIIALLREAGATN